MRSDQTYKVCTAVETINKKTAHEMGENICKSLHLMRILCIDDAENNSTVKKRQTQFKGRQRIGIDTSPKKIHISYS